MSALGESALEKLGLPDTVSDTVAQGEAVGVSRPSREGEGEPDCVSEARGETETEGEALGDRVAWEAVGVLEGVTEGEALRVAALAELEAVGERVRLLQPVLEAHTVPLREASRPVAVPQAEGEKEGVPLLETLSVPLPVPQPDWVGEALAQKVAEAVLQGEGVAEPVAHLLSWKVHVLLTDTVMDMEKVGVAQAEAEAQGEGDAEALTQGLAVKEGLPEGQLESRAEAEKLPEAVPVVLPVFPLLTVVIGALFLVLVALFGLLHLDTRLLNQPIYYGALYGPCFAFYFQVKRQLRSNYLLPK